MTNRSPCVPLRRGFFLRTLPTPPGLRAGARSTGRRSAPSTAAAASPTDLVDNCNPSVCCWADASTLRPSPDSLVAPLRGSQTRPAQGAHRFTGSSLGHIANAETVPQCETHSGGLKPELSTTRLSRAAGFHALCSESDAQTLTTGSKGDSSTTRLCRTLDEHSCAGLAQSADRRVPDLATIGLVCRSVDCNPTRLLCHEGAVLREERSQDPKQNTS
jgi:hypothetical protein